MRHEPNLRVENFRRDHPTLGRSESGKNWGYFERGSLRIISSGSNHAASEGWEHVSVSCFNRCPNWGEMCQVKEMFWQDDETVAQFHPAKNDYIKAHRYCLHLWRKPDFPYELPPRKFLA